jgi:hypothetical protein
MAIHLSAIRLVSGCPVFVSEFRLTAQSVEVNYPGNGDTLSVTLYEQFDEDNTAEASVKPTCKI